MIERIILSPRLYPLWRIGWLERSFFNLVRKYAKPVQYAFAPSNQGADVSYYQGAINFQQMKDYGMKFAIIRCGYGITKDVRFDEYMTGVNGILPHKTSPNAPKQSMFRLLFLSAVVAQKHK